MDRKGGEKSLDASPYDHTGVQCPAVDVLRLIYTQYDMTTIILTALIPK